MMKLTAALTILAATAGGAQADITTDASAFLAANPGLNLIDFEGIAPEGDFMVFDFTPQGVTFVNGGPQDDPVVISRTATSVQFGMGDAPSDYIVQGFNDTPLGFTFTGEVTSVGFNVVTFSFGNDFTPFDAVIEAFNGGTLLESIQFTTELLASFDSYVGFSNLGTNITSIRVSPTDAAGRVVAIDNLSFGVPVPAPASGVLLAAIGGLAIRRRIR